MMSLALHGMFAAAAVAQTPADIVLLNGKVLTVDAADRVAQAVAVRGDKIIAVGTDADMRSLIGPRTRRIDLHGRAVTPGLLDAHNHFSGGGADRLFVLDLSYPGVKNVSDVQAAIATQIRKLPAGAWIEGRGWDEGKLAERRLLTARDLDVVSPNNPVYLTQTTGHYGVANSVALRMAGVTKDTRDPPNGTIDRLADGSPTGVLKESAAGLVRRLVPGRTRAQTEEGMRELAKAFNAEGMTGLKDPGINQGTWDAYSHVLADSALSVRVFALWRAPATVAAAKQLIAQRAATTRPHESTGDDHLISGGVKIYMDGSGGARTAWLYDDWSKNLTDVDSGNKGYPSGNPDTIRTLIRLFHDAGMHVAVHSIGDRAIDWVVDTYAQAMREHPIKGLRHGIIHANIPTDHAIATMADLQKNFDAGYPEPSATFHWWLGDTYAANFGPQRARRLNPVATYRRNGMIWGNGSDYGVTPFAARYGIWAAVARETLLGQFGDVFGRTEAVDVHTALKAVTNWAAHQMFLEKKIGSIEVGKYADLAVWDRDFYTVPTVQLKDAVCEMTIFNGKVVYERPSAPPPREQSTRTKNIVLVMTDGLRWQEVFNGADSALVADQRLPTPFWRASAPERRAALMPFLWSTVAREGIIYGDRDAGSSVRVTNGWNVSYPGYNEILTGKTDARIRDNDAGRNANRTLFDWLESKPAFKGRVAAYGTWNTFDDIFNRDRASFVLRAGWRTPYASPHSTADSAINRAYRAARREFKNVADDTLMQMTVLNDLRTLRPRVLFVGYGETDEWAHAGRYDRVLRSAHVVDSLIDQLWTTLQSLPEYRGTTTMLITTDHGRGASSRSWRRHDEKTSGSDQTWMAMLGPDVPVGEQTPGSIDATQIAATLAAVLGEDYASAMPGAGRPIAVRR
jgi:predicted amidohydrolase YtcJ